MNALKRAIVVLIAYVLTAFSCQTQPNIWVRTSGLNNLAVVSVDVYISPEFSEREQMNIIKGVLMWEKAVNGSLVWRLQKFDPSVVIPLPCGDNDDIEYRTVLFRRAMSHDEWVTAWEARPENDINLLGLCQGNSEHEVAVLWLIEDKLKTQSDEIIIAAHEFGHALGIKHIDDKKSVMSKYYVRSVKALTKYDIAAFFNVHEPRF